LTKVIAGPTRQKEQSAQWQKIRIDHPVEILCSSMERSADCGQADIDDGTINEGET
jgi:hypothetical protein